MTTRGFRSALRTTALAAAVAVAGGAANAAVLDTFTVTATNNIGSNSNIVLQAGVDYEITISGSIGYGGPYYGDAEYAYGQDTSDTHYAGNPSGDYGVMVDGQDVYWGDYNLSHIYTIVFTGLGSTVNLALDDWAGDNRGFFNVSISEAATTAVPLPAAGWTLLTGLMGLGFLGRRRKV